MHSILLSLQKPFRRMVTNYSFFSLDKEIKDYAACNQYNCYRDTAFQTEVPTIDERHILIGSHLEK